MRYTATDLGEYVEALFQADSFGAAFSIFSKQVVRLGFDGVLYTYIPRILLASNFSREPVYKVSENYSPAYLAHYAEARFDRYDPLIKAVQDGIMGPIDWWGNPIKKYREADKSSKMVIATATDYGIANAISLPLMSEDKGISGASFITGERRAYSKLKNETLDKLQLCTRIFHSLVMSDACHVGCFIKPALDCLSTTERALLRGFATGKTTGQIASELDRSEKYLEQVMLRIRRKFSGVGPDDPPKINRNQILYYAGLTNLLSELS